MYIQRAENSMREHPFLGGRGGGGSAILLAIISIHSIIQQIFSLAHD